MKRDKKQPVKIDSFSEFVTEPPIATALLVFGLIALFLSILELSQALAFAY